jgi:hypothetical protein
MNTALLLRYAIELTMVIPAAAMAIMPVYYSRKVKNTFLFGIMWILLAAVIGGGSVFCSAFGITSNAIIFPSMIAMFLAYHICFDLSFTKKLFCFSNTVFLCGFSTTYNTFLTAPLELKNTAPVYLVSSGLICIGITVIVGAVFARTLLVKFPELFENDSLESTWKLLAIAPVVAAAGIIWMKPIDPQNAMTGRIREVSLVVLISIPLVALFLYHILWWLSKKMTERAELQQSLDMMQMVEKQYQQTRRYLNETSNARHDFRQHILVIEEYLQSGEYDKLKEYIAPIYEDVNRSHKVICNNQAVDAIANHYDEVAKAKDITIYWNIKTSDTLPIKESDMCAVIGNLVENAIQAATTLTGDDRIVNVRVGVLQEETLAIAVENAYRGTLTLDKNGLPISNKINHGIGLRSVRNIVKRYKGSMEIETHNQIFNVSILMYEPDE